MFNVALAISVENKQISQESFFKGKTRSFDSPKGNTSYYLSIQSEEYKAYEKLYCANEQKFSLTDRAIKPKTGNTQTVIFNSKGQIEIRKLVEVQEFEPHNDL